MHGDPLAPILLMLIIILAAAKAGDELFERLKQPTVLEELLFGVLLGNMVPLNPHWTVFEPLRAPVITENWAIMVDNLARLGVILLLFEVGLIFAGISKNLRVLDDALFSAIVIMVIITTLITPPVLKTTLSRWERKKAAS